MLHWNLNSMPVMLDIGLDRNNLPYDLIPVLRSSKDNRKEAMKNDDNV